MLQPALNFSPLIAALLILATAAVSAGSTYVWHTIQWKRETQSKGLKVQLAAEDREALVAAAKFAEESAKAGLANGVRLDSISEAAHLTNGHIALLLTSAAADDRDRDARLAQAVLLAAAKVEADRVTALAEVIAAAKEQGRQEILAGQKKQVRPPTTLVLRKP